MPRLSNSLHSKPKAKASALVEWGRAPARPQTVDRKDRQAEPNTYKANQLRMFEGLVIQKNRQAKAHGRRQVLH